MNPIFAFHALRELSKNKRTQRQVGRLGRCVQEQSSSSGAFPFSAT